MVSVFVDPQSKLTRGEFIKQENAGSSRFFVGNGRMTMGRGQMFNSTSGVAIEMTEQIYQTPSLNGIMEDVLFLQNIPSVLVGHLLDPQPGELILDMCSAPGGKTTHIATLARDQARIIALDKNVSKVGGVKRLCHRLGITSVEPIVLDATKSLMNRMGNAKGANELEIDCGREEKVLERIVGSNQGQIKGWQANTFDRILLDPPCSGLGNRPRLEDSQAWKALQNHAAYQRKLIHNAVPLLKPGGTLVYSTCTINPLENEENVAFILKMFPCMALVQQKPYLGFPGLTTTSLGEAEKKLVQRFDPTLDPSFTGFFIAKFTKASN